MTEEKSLKINLILIYFGSRISNDKGHVSTLITSAEISNFLILAVTLHFLSAIFFDYFRNKELI